MMSMLSKRIFFSPYLTSKTKCCRLLSVRPYCSNHDNNDEKRLVVAKMPPSPAGGYKNPFDILKTDFNNIGTAAHIDEILPVPREADIAIVGGGAIGLSVAYWLKQRCHTGMNVVVIERDPSYSRASTVLSVGGIRQQFSLPENVQMSMYTAQFFREIKQHLSVLDLDPPDIQFNPQGYLFLASEKGQDVLKENHGIQMNENAKVELVSRKKLQDKFPWLNIEDIALGSYGLENEGWFDPWLFLSALRAKCANLGVQYVKGEVVGFECKDGGSQEVAPGQHMKRQILEKIIVKSDDGETYPLTFAVCINAAGPWLADVGRMAQIGVGEGPLAIPIPVEPRKRYVYMFHCKDGPGLDMPMIIDPSGVCVRREGLGGHYICGVSPSHPDEEPDHSNLDVDYSWFHEKIWPVLSHRLPAFARLQLPLRDTGEEDDHMVEPGYWHDTVLPLLKNRVSQFRDNEIELKSAWSGYYDYNYFDENVIIGNHPYHRNFFIAGGCSGHGIQQAIPIGRAVSELILDDEFTTIDLSRFSFDRIMDSEPVYESVII